MFYKREHRITNSEYIGEEDGIKRRKRMKKFIGVLLLIGFLFVSVADARIYYVDGYQRNDGTYVSGHYKTSPDQYKWNNLDGD